MPCARSAATTSAATSRVRQPQHHRPAPLVRVARRQQRQVQPIRRRNQSSATAPGCGPAAPPYPAPRASPSRAGWPAPPSPPACHCQTAGYRAHRQTGDVPVERIGLAEPAPQFRLTMRDQPGRDIQHPRPRRATHPFQDWSTPQNPPRAHAHQTASAPPPCVISTPISDPICRPRATIRRRAMRCEVVDDTQVSSASPTSGVQASRKSSSST